MLYIPQNRGNFRKKETAMSDQPKRLASIAFLCEQQQRGYFDVLRSLDDAGVKPAEIRDLTPWYDWDQASRALERSATIRGGKR